MTEFRLPSLGADMDEATVLEWKVGPGDRMVPGEVLLVIDTEKAEMDVEAVRSGVVSEIVVPEGSLVPVGTTLARYTADDPGAEPAPAPPAPASAVARDVVATGPAPPAPAATLASERPAPPPVVSPPVAAGGVAASPLARRLAAERHILLADLTGSGPDGAVVARDVHPPGSPIGADAAVAPEDRGTSRRRAIGELMARSKREIPHYYLDEEIDLGPALERLRRTNEDLPVAERLLPAALLLRATALAAAATPGLNGHMVDGHFRPADAVNLGVAISRRGGGLMAPAILGADRLALDELMVALRQLVARTRSGRIKPAELFEATVTVTNLGEQGVRTVHPVIVPPQVAMVGFGRIAERPVVADGVVRSAPTVVASLAADHRVSDGLDGARFLNTLAAGLADLDHLFAREGACREPAKR